MSENYRITIIQLEDQLLEGCKKGNRKSFEILYQRYSSLMLGICFRYSASYDEAHDIMQEGFIKVFQNIKTFRGNGSFEGWIKRIMINTAIDHYKKNNKYTFNDNVLEQLPDEDNNEELETRVAVKSEDLMNIIQALPEGYKMVFNMYAIEGMSHKEISEVLNISVNTSKSQLFKARKWLLNKLKENNIV